MKVNINTAHRVTSSESLRIIQDVDRETERSRETSCRVRGVLQEILNFAPSLPSRHHAQALHLSVHRYARVHHTGRRSRARPGQLSRLPSHW